MVWHLFAFTGFFGYDDLQYAEVAARMMQGAADWNDHFSFRWTITGATALAYKLLGINDIASSLPAMLVSLATLGLITLPLRRYSLSTVAAALGLFSLNFWSLFYSDKLMPDIYVAFFVTGAILVYYHVYRMTRRNQVTSGILFALALMGAFLSKETVVLVLPLLGWWLIRDLRRGGRGRFWVTTAITGLLLLGGYLLAVALLTGDPASRMTALLGNRYVSFCDYSNQPLRQLLVRISYGWVADLTRQGMMAGVILTLPALWLLRIRKKKETGSTPGHASQPSGMGSSAALQSPVMGSSVSQHPSVAGPVPGRLQFPANGDVLSASSSATSTTAGSSALRSFTPEITGSPLHPSADLTPPGQATAAGSPPLPAPDPLRFFVSTAVVLLLSANFMTITPWAYNPMCTDPRHFLFLIPTLAISGALALNALHRNRGYWAGVLGTTILFSLQVTAEKSQTLFDQLLPMAGLALAAFTLLSFRRNNSRRTSGQNHCNFWHHALLPVMVLLLIALMAIKPIRYISYARKVNYAGQKAFVREHLLNGPYDRVYTDEVQRRILRYYQGFREESPEVFNWEEALGLPDHDTVGIAILINRHTSYLSGGEPGKDPWMATRPELVATKVAEDETAGLALYARRGWVHPRIKATCHHGFEEEHPQWSGGRVVTPEVGAASGMYCDAPEEYSATFRIAADSLQLTPGGHLLVTCRLQFNTPARTEAVVVISAPSTGEKELWEGIPLFPQVRAFGTWRPVVVHTLLESDLILPGSEVSVYLWNLKKETIYADDWEITLSDLPPTGNQLKE